MTARVPSAVILDTNVLFELARPRPEPTVVTALQRISDRSYISVISLAELRLGVEFLEEGRRRSELLHHVRSVQDAYQSRTLPLAATVVENYAVNVALLRRRGISISVNDAYIAATAVTHDAVLFTRNLRDFQGYPGLEAISPWPSPHPDTPGA
ncbi:VapC toxin family PIN domain ribonuclease [Brachybacterium vulturis]|uniref:Ribonuclease VapC n=1 Tax=Brachybacterium vulturis TaxID=2017484 RepID=A0A291GL86_9MICO|nr:PIN domain-containing protein [Brachybacterium vulturis]ATG50822.1 VapC toxin family PIN domain ribonuclease [Brachybacterium vulturis]